MAGRGNGTTGGDTDRGPRAAVDLLRTYRAERPLSPGGVSNNTAANTGGGIDMSAGGAVTAVNTTIADNAATTDGGGIYSSGILDLFGGQSVPATVTLTNVTVAGNSASQGAGVFNGGESTLTLANTIIGEDTGSEVSNGASAGTVAIGSTIAVRGQDLVQGGLAGFPAVLSADPLLGPLQNNGGPTPTMALLPGSPAIDAGVNNFALDLSGNSLTTDQRGHWRICGASVDLGAYELTVPATPTVSVSDAGGHYNLKPFAATATVAGVNGIVGTSLEGVTPTLKYYKGSTASGTPLAGAPTLPGTYTVKASFAGSADYTAASATTTFTIQTPTTSITGPTIGVPGQPLTYTFAVNGPTQGIAFTINYGDGTSVTTSAGGPRGPSPSR
jgi:hypothetical protein